MEYFKNWTGFTKPIITSGDYLELNAYITGVHVHLSFLKTNSLYIQIRLKYYEFIFCVTVSIVVKMFMR